ncbi:bifunctional tRNA (adenosine(37)-N6)-threonylcarbamoyltransferase complex ATPase subunit type 1 TsaE/phosphotransferase [Brucella endophytica]|uniref:tRNA threonylcarbamoyladenosine biosynthesis protein TsaE n=1 Tax=Brucella endophytica TaxID=1963359 RepID=A0A916WEF2_9HYPH|nr:tRNA (adenosine(37)-N6)-threonylcarbamoyltransferase complex ATPase subunit type 1 TsaE [Brucella endophytica]GGA90396.1 bifunctional tRNA (adenosine(37)-N6)-threonylcarbamoyltransferase complex ATPase subunit type 1 TsaE/phosphotransferase [Brucella endophytica]
MRILNISLANEAEAIRFGEDFALALARGDLVTLSGDLGAGKSTLARAVIRTLANDHALDVPSPTFTLVQSYPELRLPVAHADLYRLSSGAELDELGLEEALQDGVVLAEWPERGEGYLPPPAFTVKLLHEGEGRKAVIEAEGEPLKRLERSLHIRRFLEESGRGGASRRYLLGDASPRGYEIIGRADGSAEILMNAPPMPYDPPVKNGKSYRQIAHLAENIFAFAGMNRLIKTKGFRTPDVLAEDLDNGVLLLEHLGDEGVLDGEGKPIPERYEACARLLAHVHRVNWPRETFVTESIAHTIPDFDRDAMMIEVELMSGWYAPWVKGHALDAASRVSFEAAWDRVFQHLDGAEKSLVLRDFHSPNILWRGEAEGHGRIGLIDFQDAMIGPAAYDLASLAQDARATIEPELEAHLFAAYCDERLRLGGAFDEANFRAAYAIMAAQRNSKILGIFVRLNKRDGKPYYLKHLPRIRAYLRRALAHPVLNPMRLWYEDHDLLRETE